MSIVRRGKKGIYSLVETVDGKQVWKSLHTTDKAIAREVARIESARLRTHRLPAEFRKIPTAQARDAYLADCEARLRANNYKGTKRRLTFILDKIDAPFLKDIKTEGISRALNEREAHKKWEPKTFNHYRNDLRAFLNWCIDRQWLIGNPAKPLKPRRVDHKPVDYLSQEEINRILAALDGYQCRFKHEHDRLCHSSHKWLRPAIATAIYAGLRQSELRALEWEHVDFASKTITVASHGHFRTKTGHFRIVPLSAGLAAILKPFARAKGSCFAREGASTFQKAWYRLRSRLKFPARWNWLTFRHTFGTQCALAGVPLAKLSEWMGHTSPSVTARYYIGKQHSYDAAIERFSPGVVSKNISSDL